MTSASNPIRELEHTHERISVLVLQLTEFVANLRRAGSFANDARRTFARLLHELRDELLSHCAREEEGLFPYVREHLPGESSLVDRVVMAHDGICGTVLHLSHLAETGPSTQVPSLMLVFQRFEHLYAQHARDEAELLRRVGRQLDAQQRHEVAELVRGL